MWWTPDDVLSLGSAASTKEDVASIFEGRGHPFNDRCLADYLDEETGRALLTPMPARHATSARLARRFPQAKVAQVIRPFAAVPKEFAEGQ